MAGWASSYLRNHGNVAESFATEHAPVAFDFGRRAERLGVVVGELNRGLAFDSGHLADQADWVEVAAARGLAAAANRCQPRFPNCTATNTPVKGPPFRNV